MHKKTEKQKLYALIRYCIEGGLVGLAIVLIYFIWETFIN